MPDLPWNTALPDDWVAEVTKWEWSKWHAGGEHVGWEKSGLCPRCGHTIAVYQVALDVRTLAVPVDAECNCVGTTHDDRPEGAEEGCGVGYGYEVWIPGVQR